MRLKVCLLSILLYTTGITHTISLKDIPQPILAEEEKDGFNRISLDYKNITDIAGIDTLNITYQNATVPLAEVPNLQLNLSGNQLTTLPDSIGNLANLQQLYLSGNQLTTLPDSIDDLSNLQELNLSENQLTALPDSIGSLSNLYDLWINGNLLTALPDSIGDLTNLQELNLSANKLTTVPDSISNLTNLQNLYLYENLLTALPDSMHLLVLLQELRTTDNIEPIADALLAEIQSQRGPKLAEWRTGPLPLLWYGKYHMLNLTYMGLTDIAGISTLQVKEWDSENKIWQEKPITAVDSLAINFLGNPNLTELAIEELASLEILRYLAYEGKNETLQKLAKRINTRSKALSSYVR